jgi:putative transposase
MVMVGDGALGLWAALRDVFPETRHQRDWVHKAANVLGCPPAAVHAVARKALAEIRDAQTGTTLFERSRSSPATTGPSGPRPWPRSPATPRSCSPSTTSRPSIVASEDQQPDRVDVLLGEAQNPRDQGPRLQGRGLAMAFKLLEAAQDRWRAVNGPHLVALVRAGARFDKGVMIERPDEAQEVAA